MHMIITMLIGMRDLMGRLKMLVKKPIWKRICHEIQHEEFTFVRVRDLWAEWSPSTCPTTMQLATILRSQPQVYIVEHQKDLNKSRTSTACGSRNYGDYRRQTYGICAQWILDNPL